MMGEIHNLKMIDQIQGIRAQGSPAISGNKKAFENQTETSVLLPANEDMFIPNGSRAECPNEKLSRKKLSPEMASALASKYDVSNMTRNEYGNLLRELRDSGVISSKDFSVGYGGAVPYTAPDGVRMTMGDKDDMGLEPWPFDGQRADFTKLLRSCAKYCERFVSAQEDGDKKMIGSSLGDSYHELLKIFEQIGKTAKQKSPSL